MIALLCRCLYEAWHTYKARGPNGLLLLTSRVDVSRLEQVFTTLDISTAQATQEADRTRILGAIAASIGIQELNMALKRALVDSARHAAAHATETGAALSTVQFKAAALLQASGSYSRAVDYYRGAMDSAETALGTAHGDTLACVTGVADCLLQMGHAQQWKEEALSLYQRALDGTQQNLGSEHPDTLAASGKLAACLVNLQRCSEALPLLQRSLQGQQAALGAAHPATLATACHLAACYEGLQRFEDALPLHQQALSGFEAELGASHLNTLSAAYSLALCLARMGRHEEALPLLQRVIDGRANALGERHPKTEEASSAAGACAKAMGLDWRPYLKHLGY